MRFFSLIIIVFIAASCSNENATKQVAPVAAQETMDSIATAVSRARNLYNNGNNSDALQAVNALLQRYPGQLDALGLKAEILKSESKSAEALQVLEQAFALEPRDKETAYNLAYEYADAGNTKALLLADTLLKYDKTETVARAWFVKATYYTKTGNTAQALRLLDSAVVADYNFMDAHLEKGQILFNQKKYEAALRSFALGQKMAPGTAEFYYWVGRCQEALNQKEDALANYERALALEKNFTEARQAVEKLMKEEAGGRR